MTYTCVYKEYADKSKGFIWRTECGMHMQVFDQRRPEWCQAQLTSHPVCYNCERPVKYEYLKDDDKVVVREDAWIKRQAEIYLKLRPFLRRSGNRLIWDPTTDIGFAPTFEQFLDIQNRKVIKQRLGFPLYVQLSGRALRKVEFIPFDEVPL